MRPPPFILVRKSNAPQGPQTGLPGGVLLLELDGPDSRRSTCGPTPSKYPGRGTAPTSVQKPAHRAHTAATEVSSSLTASCLSLPDVSGQKWVRATPANAPGCRLRQAGCSACPTRWWVIRFSECARQRGNSGVIITRFLPQSIETLLIMFCANFTPNTPPTQKIPV